MKILIIVRILWPGGVQRIAFAEAKGLIDLGNDVDLVFIRDTGRVRYDDKIKYNAIYKTDIQNRFIGKILKIITHHYSPERGSDATVDLDLIYKFEHSITKKYDIIYCFDEFTALFVKRLKKIFKSKIIVLIHEVALKEGGFLSKSIQKYACKNADLILTNTKFNLNLFKEYGYNNSYEVYPGLYYKNNPTDFYEKENIAISVTMWDSGRHPEIFLNIARNLNFGKIVLIGNWADNFYFDKFKNTIKNENLSHKLSVTGAVSEEELNEFYLKAKVSIRFGYNEKGPGMGSLESLSYGLPIIYNNGIGIKEILEDNINGYKLNENDYSKIANQINILFSNNELWENIHKNNLKIANEYSWESHNIKLNKILENTLKFN